MSVSKGVLSWVDKDGIKRTLELTDGETAILLLALAVKKLVEG